MLIKTPMTRLTQGKEVREWGSEGTMVWPRELWEGTCDAWVRRGCPEKVTLPHGRSLPREGGGRACSLRLRKVQRRRCDARSGEGVLSPAGLSPLAWHPLARIFKSRGERISKEMSPPIPSPYRRRSLASLPDLASRFLEKRDPIS